MHRPICVVSALAFAASLIAGPARADGPVSIYAGMQSVGPASQAGAGSPLIDAGIGYDLGPKTVVPVRLRLDASDAFASSALGGSNAFGLGADVHLTTPLYGGFGATLDYVTVPQQALACPVLAHTPNGPFGCGPAPPTSTIGGGVRVFAGATLLNGPGPRLAIEGSYKTVPAVEGIDTSGFGIGLRLTL